MAKQEYKVSELVGMINRGEMKLPEMQRQYVWTASKVRDLLDSLYRGYPSGVILAWQTDEAVDTRDFAVETERSISAPRMLLLDGQQRLTSLSAVLSGEQVSVRDRKYPIEILFNMAHPGGLNGTGTVQEEDEEDIDDSTDETDEKDEHGESTGVQAAMENRVFVVYSKALANKPNWVPVSEIFRDDSFAILERKGIDTKTHPDEFKAYFQRLEKVRSIRDYVYRVDLLEKEMSYEEVTEIFVRVNSLGARLRSSDLALAQITSRWRNSLKLFIEYQQELTQAGMDLEIGVILRCLIAHATGQAKFNTVGSISEVALQEAWVKTKKSMHYAVNFARTELGISSNQLLSSPFLLITLAYWIEHRDFKISHDESDGMRKWALIANAKGRYSRGSTQEYLSQDLATIRDGKDYVELLDRMKQQMIRLEIEPSDLIGRNSRSSYFKMMFVVFQNLGAKDWETKLPISVNHLGKNNQLQFHHIFPKKYLDENRKDLRNSEIDDIANLAFISATTNQEISAKAPSAYIGAFVDKGNAAILEQHCVPLTPELWTPERYEDFLHARRLEIVGHMNRFIFGAMAS
jgi:hypothetical protein